MSLSHFVKSPGAFLQQLAQIDQTPAWPSWSTFRFSPVTFKKPDVGKLKANVRFVKGFSLWEIAHLAIDCNSSRKKGTATKSCIPVGAHEWPTAAHDFLDFHIDGWLMRAVDGSFGRSH